MVTASDRSGRIQAEVQNSDGQLKGGIFARGKIVIEEKKQALTVPKTALMSLDIEKGTAMLFAIKAHDRAVLKNVKTGLSADDSMEIISGITEKDEIVIRGGFNLKDGDSVSVSSRQKPENPPETTDKTRNTETDSAKKDNPKNRNSDKGVGKGNENSNGNPGTGK